MSLKADRHEARVDISFYCNQVLTRGCIVVYDSPGGSGAGMDQSQANVCTPTGLSTVVSNASGTKPAGLLLTDVVNLDLTRTHINWHQDQVQLGGKVTVLKQGYAVTNMIVGTPNPGDPAYYDGSGFLTPTEPSVGGLAGPAAWAKELQVGRFQTKKDADGYAKVEINITG